MANIKYLHKLHANVIRKILPVSELNDLKIDPL